MRPMLSVHWKNSVGDFRGHPSLWKHWCELDMFPCSLPVEENVEEKLYYLILHYLPSDCGRLTLVYFLVRPYCMSGKALLPICVAVVKLLKFCGFREDNCVFTVGPFLALHPVPISSSVGRPQVV